MSRTIEWVASLLCRGPKVYAWFTMRAVMLYKAEGPKMRVWWGRRRSPRGGRSFREAQFFLPSCTTGGTPSSFSASPAALSRPPLKLTLAFRLPQRGDRFLGPARQDPELRPEGVEAHPVVLASSSSNSFCAAAQARMFSSSGTAPLRSSRAPPRSPAGSRTTPRPLRAGSRPRGTRGCRATSLRWRARRPSRPPSGRRIGAASGRGRSPQP